MKKNYCLKKPTNRKYYYYKLQGETKYHSTGLAVKSKAEEYVQKLIYGGTQSSEFVTLRKFTQDMFILDKCGLLERMEKKGKTVTACYGFFNFQALER